MEHWQLKQKQSLPLEQKIRLSEMRIRAWYSHWGGKVYVSFSGGKDSTVLLHLVRSIYKEVPAVFVDTGLEYPEIRDFVKTIDNVVWLKPKMNFKEVIEKYGYPVVSKEQARYVRDCQNPTPNNEITRRRRMTGIDRHGVQHKSGMISKKWRKLIDSPFRVSERCCDVIKKNPMKDYVKETGNQAIIGTMAQESRLRVQAYQRVGCNAFESTPPKSMPLSVWLEEDIWGYIKTRGIEYSKIYDMGEKRTGCMFCMFGAHLEKEPNKFQRMKESHPNQWKYCMEVLELNKVLDYIGVSYDTA